MRPFIAIPGSNGWFIPWWQSAMDGLKPQIRWKGTRLLVEFSKAEAELLSLVYWV